MKKDFWKNLGLNREVAALSLARFVDAFSNSILIIILPLYVNALPSQWLNLPVETLVGILIFSFGFISSVIQPFAGMLSDYLEKKKIFILLGLVTMGISTFFFLSAQTFVTLIIIRVVQGIGFAFTIPATFSLMTSYTKMENRGGAMGIYSTMRMAGFAVGPLLGGILHVHFGFTVVFYIVGFLMLLGTVVVWILVREPKPVAEEKTPQQHLPKFTDSLNSEFVVLALSTVVMASAMTMMVALENQFNERLAQTAIGFGLAFAALTISRAILQIPLGKAADVWGRKIIIVIGFILLAPTTLLLGYVATTGQLILVRIAQGVAVSGISAPVFALAADKTTSGNSSTQISVITMSFGFGIAMGPVIAGFMSGYLNFEAPFVLLGISSLIAAFFIGAFVKETVTHKKT